MDRIKAAFFDVDGVLLDSLLPHLRICQDKSDEYGLGLRIPGVAEFKETARRNKLKISPMKYFFMAVGFPEREAERADAEYQLIFMEKYAPSPFAGVHEMLTRLRAVGLLLGFVTANVMRNVATALRDDLQFFHPSFRFAIDHPPGLSKADALRVGAKELGLRPAELVYVGDQNGDRDAALQAGVGFLGVTYGWGLSRQDVGFPLVDSPEQVADYLLGGF